MKSYLEKSIELCNSIIKLLEDDYQQLYGSLKGPIYDEYKLMVLGEIERITKLKQELSVL